jgi:aspartyl-tRNA(Asn)/glutamyl-tRNA(Gln) amidotransferase subunit A
MSVAGLATRLRAGELSPAEAVQFYLDRIEELDDAVNAYITVRAEEALAEAEALVRARGDKGPLWGVPIAVKDVIDVEGTLTTAASRILADNVASRDAHVVARLREAGAILLGKLNTHEFAYGALTTSPHFGAAHNPWALDRVCGGSSGGSAAAAAADLAAGTLGSDTAGSIRIPSSSCGVTGLRPTTGRVSNRGSIPVAWTFDTIGPITRSAEDSALLLEAIAGHDPEDPSTADVPVPPYSRRLDGSAGELRIGVVTELFERGIDGRVAVVVREAIEDLRAAGARILEVKIALFSQLGTIQQAMQFVEAAAAHRTLLRTRLSDYAPDVRARLLTGLFVPPTAYVLAQRARRLAYAELSRALEAVDILAAPTMPVLPPRVGEETVDLNGDTIPYRLTLIPFNSPWSCVGLPVASVPCGFVEGLPVGLALVGRRFDEETVLRAADAFQRLTDWHERRPALTTTAAAS